MTWAAQAGGSSYDYGYGITSLSDGSSIVTGEFSGTASFGDTTLSSAGGEQDDVFIARLSPNGLDFTPLVAPTAPDLITASDSGSSNSDNLGVGK